jgi:hypothetical protein
MGRADNRNRTMAIMTDYQALGPMKEIIKVNILQYQPSTDYYNQR